MITEADVNAAILAWHSQHGANCEERCRRMEYLADWEFLDGTGAVTVPLTDEDIAANWDADVIRSMEGIMSGEDLLDLRQCPVRVTGWKSWLQAAAWRRAQVKRTGLQHLPAKDLEEIKDALKTQGYKIHDRIFTVNILATL